jgi:adenine-specific DNA-methyltransferase
LIKYLGSKRTLLPAILAAVHQVGGGHVLDLFSGTARVGHALKAAGLRVTANDHNAYAATLARCYVETDTDEIVGVERLIAELNALPGSAGYFTETFCQKSRFFTPHNGARIDAIRERIATLDLPPAWEAVVLVALMEAADRVDSTTGVQMAYLKQWAPRALRDLELRVPAVLPKAAAGKGHALQHDAVDAAETPCDVLYLDPPYNQHKYLGNYHIWESLVRWDKPEVYGIACKRVDVRTRGSVFNSRPRILDALRTVVARTPARAIVVSFSDEGYVTREQIVALLETRGPVAVHTHDYKRYVGAQIGIHNPAGEKVGTVGRLRNEEYLFVTGSTL